MKGKLNRFVKDNIVLLVGVPLIISVHYGWYLLQQNQRLVPERQYKEMPLFTGIKYLKTRAEEEWRKLTSGAAEESSPGPGSNSSNKP